MEQPLVSIIIPTYKRPDTLDRAINSVLNQTYKNIEVIVVDDNNPDTEGRRLTESKMAPFAENPRVRYIKHEKNKNGSAARNTGARASKGEFIGFLDDDDQFLPKKIESQVAKLQKLSDDWGFCYNKYYTQRGNEKLVPVKECREGDLFLVALKQGISVNAGSNLLIRRFAFESINGFDESFKRNQDHEFLVRLLKKYKMAYVAEPGLIYSIGTTNVKFDYEEVISHYIKTFKPMLDDLSEKDRKEFYDKINKLRVLNLIHPRREYKKAFKVLCEKDVNSLSVSLYILGKTSEYFIRRIKAFITNANY